jgi:ribose transport system substrate-binding protein
MGTRIVVAVVSSTQDYQVAQAADARQAAQKAGVDVEVVSAEGNAIQQIHQLYKFIHAPEAERPAAIVVEPVSTEGLGRLARNALAAGIGWVVQQWKNDYLSQLRRENPKLPVVAVSVDEEETGRIQAAQLRALRPTGGALLVIQGPLESSTAVSRFRGLEQSLAGSRIELKRVLNGDWSTPSAEKAVRAWMRLGTSAGANVDVIASQNDSMAQGARKAFEELRPEWTSLPMTGCDGLPEGGQRMVANRQLSATIIKPTTAGPAVELLARVLLKGQPAPPELVLHAQSYPALDKLRPATAAARA